MEKNLSFDFKKAVDEAYKDFPVLKGWAAFYDSSEDKLYKKGFITTLISKLSNWKSKAKEGDSYVFSKKSISYMVYDRSVSSQPCTIGDGTFVFDHELGHVLMNSLEVDPRKHPAYQAPESLADAFGVIRHFQRGGIDDPRIAALAHFRTWEAASSDDYGHYSLPVIAHLWAERHNMDFKSLTPDEAWAMAEEYTAKYAVTKEEASVIRMELSYKNLQLPGTRAGAEKFALSYLELMATTSLTTANRQTCLMSAWGVISAIDDPGSLLTDPKWKTVAEKIYAHACRRGLKELIDPLRENAWDITVPTKKRGAHPAPLSEQRAAISRILSVR